LKTEAYTLVRTETRPDKDRIGEGKFWVEYRDDVPRWAYCLCPCGCHGLVMMSLYTNHEEHWIFTADYDDLPTVTPVIRRKTGCRSQFYIQSGKVLWA
jgi:hypothetical protein